VASGASGKYTPLFANSAHGIQTVVDIAETPGNVWFVSSTATGGSDASGYGRRPDKPFATLAYAYSSDVLAANDTVYVMPGHVETIAGAGSVTADIAGVTVIGLGSGAARPTFNFTGTASTILITAASTKWVNLLTVANTAVDVVDGIIVSGADCTLVDIEGREDGTTKQFVLWLRLHTGAARARLIRPRFLGAAGDAGVAAIKISGVIDGVYIEDAWCVGIHSSGTIFSDASATDTMIVRAFCRQGHATKDSGIALAAGNTAVLRDCMIQSATNDADGFNLAIVAAAGAVFNPSVVNLAGERGGAWGTASAAA
jgi:hypothetical protein